MAQTDRDNKFNLKAYQYKRMLEERRGNNFQYLNDDSYQELLDKGYEFYKPMSSLDAAKETVLKSRENGYFSRIVCFAQGQIRTREYIVIRKNKG